VKPTTVTSEGKEFFDFGGLGIRWKIGGPATQGRFSVVHHPIAPYALAAPLHYYHNGDEYSYVLRGTLGALLGDDVVTAGLGTWVFKPRQQWHTFGNPGDEPCEIIEVISRQDSRTTSVRSQPPGETCRSLRKLTNDIIWRWSLRVFRGSVIDSS
jgi:mannose-6-phosphate isomerase-like protein (cupin superfamily)